MRHGRGEACDAAELHGEDRHLVLHVMIGVLLVDEVVGSGRGICPRTQHQPIAHAVADVQNPFTITSNAAGR